MKSRLFFCDYWESAEVNSISPQARYLGVYFWTNQRANLIGLFGMTNPYIVLETGIKEESIEKAKNELEKLKLVYFFGSWIYLPNAQEVCGYTSEKKHGIAAQKELSRIPADVLDHFRSLGYKIPYPYTTDSPLNQKSEIKNFEQENKTLKSESEESRMMTDEESQEMADWAIKELDKEEKNED